MMGLVCLFVVAILGASWVPDSHMSKVSWIPDWLGRWADHDKPVFRTGVALFTLSVLVTFTIGWRGQKWTKARFWAVIVFCFGCLTLAEFGQMFLPNRTTSLGDFVWGSAGIWVGFLVGYLGLQCRDRALGLSGDGDLSSETEGVPVPVSGDEAECA